MTAIAINILWFLIGLIILDLAIWAVSQFICPIPAKIVQGIWVIVLLLALIALTSAVAGGGLHMPSIR
jgi:hypothetical protein